MPGSIDRPPDLVSELRAMRTRIAQLERLMLGSSLSGKTFTDVDQANVTEPVGGIERQGNEFEITLPANALLGVYMRSVMTNAESGSEVAHAGVTVRFAPGAHPLGNIVELHAFIGLLQLQTGPVTTEKFTVPGSSSGDDGPAYGGIVILDDGVGPPDPVLTVSSEPQTFQIGFGYGQTGGGSMDFEDTRMHLFFL